VERQMLTTFTLLAYAFCAALLPAGATEIVAVGYISLDRCFVQVETVESTIKLSMDTISRSRSFQTAPSSESMPCVFLFRKRHPSE
jgi:hypothetical protein